MSLRRLAATTRLDLSHNLKRPLFWIWFGLIALLAWGFSDGDMVIQSGDSDVGGTKAFITSEFAVAMALAVLVPLLHSFFIAVGAGMTVLRDEELQVGAVLHATPLTPHEYVWGKFFAVLLSFLLMLALHVALTIGFYHGATDAADADFVGPFALQNYLRPALLLALPTVFTMTALCFWIGARFRRAILVFFLPVALLLLSVFFLWQFSPGWLPEIANRALMWIDLTGFRWLSETYLDEDRGVAFYNLEPVDYELHFLISRGAWVLLGLFAVIAAARHFERSLRGRSGVLPDGKLPDASQTAAPARRPITPPALAALGMRQGRAGFLRGLAATTRVEFRELLGSPGLYLFLPLIVLETVMNSIFARGPFDTTPLLTSGVLATAGFQWLSSLVCLLLLFYTVESLRREAATGLESIHYATPMRTTALLFGKALANSLVGVVAIGVTLLSCLTVLAFQGIVPLDVTPFLLLWCVVLLPTFLLWTSFVSFVYSLFGNRYTTYAVALAAFAYTAYVQQTGDINWVFNWPLWGTLQWSDMGLFELVREELILNRALALVGTIFFTILTVRLFPRRRADATNRLLRLRPKPLLLGAVKLSPVWATALLLAMTLQQRIDAGSQGAAGTKASKDYWRKNVATWNEVHTADLTRVRAELDLFPETKEFECKGEFTLTNRSEAPLHAIPLTRGLGWRRPDSLGAPGEGEADAPLWTLDGQPFEPEDAAGLMVFELEEPLAPDASVRIGFHHSGEVPFGVTANGGGASEFILPSGIVLTSFSPSFVPVVGFVQGVGVDEDNQSDSKCFDKNHFEGVTRSLFGGGYEPYPVHLTVSAPEAYTINGIGQKTRDEIVDGRRTVVWETDHPVRFFNVVAGKWDVIEGEHGTAIYYHPGHDHNVERMIDALDGARVHFSEWFYPYPWQELKISEFPALAGYAQGFATNIPFSESIGFLTRAEEDAADAPFMVTAHETAHQWWGNILTPGEGPGGNLLSEGTAHFSTLLLFEEMEGLEARIAFATNIESSYANTRVADSEKPLVLVDGSRPGDTTLTYDKAGWVFWMLLNHMGRENCLEGIRSFIAHYAADRDHPVLQDFVAHLRPFAPDAEAYDAFTEQWFYEVVIPRYELEEVEREQAADGGWIVRGTISNVGTGTMEVALAASRGERFAVDEVEAETAEGEADASYRGSRTTLVLAAEESLPFEIHCDFEPERVVVDPDAEILMLGRDQARHDF